MKQSLSVLWTASGLAAILAVPGMGAALHTYTNVVHYDVSVSEASAVSYDRDTDTLFVMGDEGDYLVQVSKTGETIDSMGFDNSGERAGRTLDDSEGLAYMGGGKVMIADERRNVAWLSTYVPNTVVGKGVMPSYAFGPYDGNTGLEGIAYDPVTNSLWGIKEQNPLMVYQMSNITGDGEKIVTNPFPGNRLTRAGLSSLSDIFILASSHAFSEDDPRRMNILLLARDDQRIVEMTRTGEVVDSLDISSLQRGTIEGMTMDDKGTIYLVAEQTPALQDKPALFVLNSSEAPAQPFGITATDIRPATEDGMMVGELSWVSEPGKIYDIEYSADLTSWQKVSDSYTATETLTSGATSPLPGKSSGFFRVVQTDAP